MSLDYDLSSHLHCRLSVPRGGSVELRMLRQEMTYSGLIEGHPYKIGNDQFVILNLLQQAQKDCVPRAKPLMLEPERRAYLRVPGDMDRVNKRGGDPVEWLPLIACIGYFEVNFETGLTVVWFQHEYAMPIEDRALRQLRELNWEKLGTKFEV